MHDSEGHHFVKTLILPIFGPPKSFSKHRKHMKALSSILLFLFVLNIAWSQCEIFDMTAVPSACNEEGNFHVTIDFNYSNVGDDGFKIQGGGIVYGTFSYSDLPITLEGLSGDCITEYEFVARDISQPDCSDFVLLGPICCDQPDCSLNILEFQAGECNNNHFPIHFNLEHSGTTNSYFEVFGNGIYLGYHSFNDLPITIENFPSSDEPLEELIVCENDNGLCCDTIYFITPCSCSISGVQTRKLECNAEDSTYFLKINFNHYHTSDSFQLGSNAGFFGYFGYNQLPIVIGPIAFSADTLEFLIADQQNTLCFEEFIIAPYQECNTECDISNIQVTTSPCEDNHFYAHITFDYNNPGVHGFKIQGNGQVYGTYLYGNDEYVVGPLLGNCSTNYEFAIVDVDYPNCNESYQMPEPVCCEGCIIQELQAIGICELDNRKVKVNFDHNQPPSSHFNLKINGVFIGNYEFGSLPIIVEYDFIPGQEYSVFVYNEICEKEGNFVLTCSNQGDCDISNLEVTTTACENNEFYAHISFDYSNTGDHGFMIRGNGVIYGTYEYGQDEYIVGPLVANCVTKYEFAVVDVDHPTCKDVYNMTEPVCCDGECSITEMNAIGLCENDDKKVKINFEHNQAPTSEFHLKINGVFIGTYLFAELPIIVDYDFTPGQVYSIFVYNEHCEKEEHFTLSCSNQSSCEIYDLVAEPHACNEDGYFLMDVAFQHNQGVSNTFKIIIGEHLFGPFEYGQSVYTVGPLNGDCTVNKVIVQDLEHGDCRDIFEFEHPICCEGACSITEMTAIGLCENDIKKVKLNFDHNQAPTTQFNLKINGVFIGTYTFGSLPIIFNYNFNPGQVYSFFVYNETCEKEEHFALTCSNQSSCEIYDLVAEPHACNDDGYFLMDVAFQHNQGVSNTFKIIIGEHIFGPFEYGQTFYTVGPLNGDCTVNKVIVQDLEHGDCRDIFEFEHPICCNDACSITEMSAIGFCENDNKKVKLNFDHNQAPTTQFNLKINGVFIGTYTFGSLPIIFNYNFNPGQVYSFFVYNETCDKEAHFALNCSNQSSCEIYDLVAEAFGCNQEGNFSIHLAFHHNDKVSNTFKVLVGDKVFGPFEYGQTSYTIGPLKGDCTIDKVIVRDLEHPDCGDVFEFDHAICCNSCNLKFGDIIPVCQNEHITAVKLFVTNTGSNSDSFNLRINGANYGSKAYSNSPYLINIPDQGPGTFNFRIADLEVDNCVKEISKELNCVGNDCQLGELHVQIVECHDETFRFKIDFANQNTPSDSFYIWIKNELYGPYKYGKQPIITEPYNKTETPFRVRIEDTEKEACALQIVFEHINCETDVEDITAADGVKLAAYGGQLMINSLSDLGQVKIEIFDVVGRQMSAIESQIPVGITLINSDITYSGMYLVKISNDRFVISSPVFLLR